MLGLGISVPQLSVLARAIAAAWSPLSLWPDGISSPGMWISPRTLTSEWQDYNGTTPVSVPGTVADASNPVGLALDIRAGATVLTDPGNHMLQSTSAARPLMSARVNTLTYTEDFSHTWSWPNGDIATTNKLAAATNSSPHGVRSTFPAMNNPQFTVRASAAEYGFLHLVSGPGMSPNDGVSYFATFDLANGTVIKDGSWGTAAQIVAVGGGVYDCSVVSIHTGSTDAVICYGPTATTNAYLGDGTSGVNVFRAQISYEGAPYQAVLGNGSTYATDFPIFQKYDGVDDGMATAAFTAGTLTSAMDCMIAVRRNNNANLQQILGLYQADQTKYFGVVSGESPNFAGTFGGCGTPTIFVNGVETANTRGDLFDAMPYGEWCILEYRGLDLSAWVNANFGNYGSEYRVNGARGDILLYPSTASTEDKDAARQYLADYYGVTLP